MNQFWGEEFASRHIGPDEDDVRTMLAAVGSASLDALMDEVVPPGIRREAPMALPPALSEGQALARLADYAGENSCLTSLIGMGYYNTVMPAVIQRNVWENPAWYTAYTPYQPEISQGRLEALLNFQTMVTDLTGMEMANASLLDEGTAAAEAMMIAHRRASGERFLVDPDVHPQTRAVLETRAAPIGVTLVTGDAAEGVPENCCGALIQYPASTGRVADPRPAIRNIQAAGGFAVVASDLLALTALMSPGEMGADIVVGTSQRFGVPMGYGGPHAAFFATRQKYQRTIPGRIVGVSVDRAGHHAYRLALQTREQHIRREKATSNICTAQVLPAIIAGFYAVWHGPEGLRAMGERVHRIAATFADAATRSGFTLRHEAFFDTVVLETGERTGALLDAARAAGFNLRPLDGALGISFDEITDPALVKRLIDALGIERDAAPEAAASRIPDSLMRHSQYLTHPVFSAYRSETEMLRYLRRLADKDLALDRAMIPLGSCTMKLNATTEMIPISWPGFNALHPFIPADQAGGYTRLVSDLEDWLCRITGYDRVSLQPNAGAQGEFAGLMAIRAWHESRGEGHRDVCLIPVSAHGTNPASAAMSGMRVVLVDCDDHGNVDVADLERKAREHSDNLAATMITYPSTHGVFEEAITEICRIVHDHEGQVFVDGANLNALIGVSSLPELGADVTQLNLHKTFSIPHGGGGPGVGPVAVARHLANFLPGDPMTGSGAVSAAPLGNASVLPISWAYIAMMGGAGLSRATTHAILAANYVASRLQPYFPVLYTGRGGRVAHECIIDLRDITEATGVSNEDVAKRLIDYGFHAPTMSFPVPGTLMIEPTESESLGELDRFCDAMIAIKWEIDQVAQGVWPQADNPLGNAPHTAADLTADDWGHPYSRGLGALLSETGAKYWPPVGRVDNAWGDRNVFCTCPSPVEWRGAAE